MGADKQMSTRRGDKYCSAAIDRILWNSKELFLGVRKSFQEVMTVEQGLEG